MTINQTPAQRFVAIFATPPDGIEWELAAGYDADRKSVSNLVDLLNIKRKATAPKGTGALAMAQLCRTADEMGIDIQLSVTPKDQHALVPYYKRFGFFETPPMNTYGYIEMLRASARG